MSEIKEIVDSINLPKQIIEKGELLLKTLFGPSFNELGETFADQVRARRFKNQLTIFSKAQDQLRAKGLNPQKVSLKVLAPLVDFSSLEEDENLQEKWANLIANVLSSSEDSLLFQNCISILNRISSGEAQLLDSLYKTLDNKRWKLYNEDLVRYEKNYSKSKPEYPPQFRLENWNFDVDKLAKESNVESSKLRFQITNLVTLGTIKWETDVEIGGEKIATVDDLQVQVSNNDYFILTPLGIKFVELCIGSN